MLRAVETEIAAGRPEQALRLCQDVQSRFPRSLHVQQVLGEVYLALRKTREAVAALDRALAGNPEDARACCARAIVQQIQGDSLGALAWYRRACDIRPTDRVLRLAYGELASSLNQSVYAPTRLGLAWLYLRADLLQHATREWESILADDPDSIAAHVGVAESLWRAGDEHGAADRCRRALLKAPTAVKALLILALIEQQAGNTAENARLMQRVEEIDPELRIGQDLFADQIAAGDPAVGELLKLKREAPIPVAAGREQAPITARPQPVRAVTMPPRTPPIGRENHPSKLPPNFDKIFAETRNMLWDDEENEAGERRAQETPFERSRADMFARSNMFIPPVLREHGASLDDTETRAAINWLSWLQAQGAITREMVQRATGSQALRPSDVYPARHDGGDVVTGPLPPWVAGAPARAGSTQAPTPEALRAMFAELEPDRNNRIVDGDIVDTEVAPQPEPEQEPAHPQMGESVPVPSVEEESFTMPRADEQDTPFDAQPEQPADEGALHAPPEPADQEPDFSHPSAAEADDIEEMETGQFEALSEGDVSTDDLDATAPLYGSQERPEQPVMEHDVSGDDAPVTLESLERQFAQSGFESYDLRPGSLEALSGTEARHEAPAEVAQPSVPEFERDETSEASTAESAPDPADFPARLDLARKRREAGRLSEALAEYRAVLKNAPDLLGDVVSDLEQSVASEPDQPELHRLLGDARVRQGDYLSALESYNRAVALAQNQSSSI